jgi:GT2 family glycosyltransferase
MIRSGGGERHAMLISLIVCTCNRRDKLQTLLGALEKLDLAGDFTFEVVVVDNNSTDGTDTVIREASTRSALTIRYAFEREQGLGHARNRGVLEARGDVLVFTDDDCIPDTNWIRAIGLRFAAEPSLAGLGGRVELYDESDQAVTVRLKGEIADFQSVHQLFNLIPGCNMAFRRHVLTDVGPFDPVFGAGTKLASGEDSDFLYRAYKLGLRITYYPEVLVYHNHGRKTDAQVNALRRGYGCGRGAFYCKHIVLGDRVVLEMALRDAVVLVRHLTRNILARRSIARHALEFWGLTMGLMRGLPIFLRRAIASR